MNEPSEVSRRLLAWWDEGHTALPWRETRDPYAIWVAEVMLQQTQIATVLPYYRHWMARYPTVATLAQAPLSDVLKSWEGLGYYGRARNLHAAAKTVVDDYDGCLPAEAEELIKLKGIGRYTAGAISSIAFGRSTPVLDGNVIRVLSRLDDLEDDVTRGATQRRLWRRASELVPGLRNSMSPCPSRTSAPFWSRTMRLSCRLATRKLTRQGMFDLIRPVTTLTEGRCVARMRCIPDARAF